MKIKLLAVALFFGASGLSSAANYIISNVDDGLTDTLYADSANNLLSGGIVTLGVFTAGFDVDSNLTNLPALIANFTTIFASGAIGGPSSTLGGSFPGYTEYDTVDTAPLLTGNALIGRTLYSFVGDGATLGGSTAVALMNMGLLQNEDGGELDYVSNPEVRVGSPLIGNLDVKTGDFAGQGSSTFTTLKLVTPVPEPSAALLGIIGALGLLRRRRN